MTCRRCKHPRASHEDGGCRIKILTNWSEPELRFTGCRPCECTGFASPVDVRVNKEDCPHELQTDSEHPQTCVHCGVTVEKQPK